MIRPWRKNAQSAAKNQHSCINIIVNRHHPPSSDQGVSFSATLLNVTLICSRWEVVLASIGVSRGRADTGGRRAQTRIYGASVPFGRSVFQAQCFQGPRYLIQCFS